MVSTDRGTLREVEGGTEVAVVMDVTLEFLDFFSKARPRAIESTMRLAEMRRYEWIDAF